MHCSSYSESMSLHLDGLMDRDQALQLQKHLAQCEDCRQEWEVMSQLSVLLQAEPAAAPVPGFAARVTLRVQQRAVRQRRLYSGIGLCIGSLGLWIVSALSLLLVFFAIWYPVIRMAVLDVGISLLNDILSLVLTLGKALWSAVHALSTRPSWLFLSGYALLALVLAMLWTRVVLRQWGFVRSRIRI